MKKKTQTNKEYKIPVKIFNNTEEKADKENFDMVGKNGKEGIVRQKETFNKKKFRYWFPEKTEEERKKIMWVMVSSFLIVIITVWVVFLKYNITLESLSLDRMKEAEEWETFKKDFTSSIENFGEDLSKIRKNQTLQKEQDAKSAELNIDKNKIEKLKEKILNKDQDE